MQPHRHHIELAQTKIVEVEFSKAVHCVSFDAFQYANPK